MAQTGRFLLVLAAFVALVGLGLLAADKFGLGKLPGDLVFKGKRTTFHFPIVTSLLVSVVLTVLLNLWFHSRR